MIEEAVPAALGGERLDRIVALIGDLSRADAAATIAAGGVLVDGVGVAGKVRLTEGQIVSIDPSKVPVPALPAADPDVQFGVVHEDEWVIVVDKPAGLVVHPGAGNPDGTLVSGLLARFPDVLGVGGDPLRPGIVHRLDAGSSGLLVVARTDEAAEALIEQFADHSATRRYDAVVWGVPEAPHGIIDAPIGRDRGDPLKMAVVAGGKPARTDYRVIGTYSSPAVVSRIECRLETGRTHQIRVHLASIGHPLVGDPWYGQRRPVLGLSRPFLHAAELAFDHPGSGERVTFNSDLAPDLQSWLAAASA